MIRETPAPPVPHFRGRGAKTRRYHKAYIEG
jgi:hypothetical protein